jgi:hypothetical protein
MTAAKVGAANPILNTILSEQRSDNIRHARERSQMQGQDNASLSSTARVIVAAARSSSSSSSSVAHKPARHARVALEDGEPQTVGAERVPARVQQVLGRQVVEDGAEPEGAPTSRSGAVAASARAAPGRP